MAKRILVPFDMSKYSLEAANEAIELAKLSEGNIITFLHVVEPEPAHDEVYDSSLADRQREDEITAAASRWFSQIEEISAKNEVPSKLELLFDRSSVVQAIADYAKDIGADVIVIGHSTRYEFGRRLEGDVAKGVIDRAQAPYLV